MTDETAIKKAMKIIRELVKKERHRLAFDANMAATYGAEYPQALRAKRQRDELAEALAVLEEITGKNVTAL